MRKISIFNNIILFMKYGKYLFKKNREKVNKSELLLKRPYNQRKVLIIKRIFRYIGLLLVLGGWFLVDLSYGNNSLNFYVKIILTLFNLIFIAHSITITAFEDIDFNNFQERQYYFRSWIWFWFIPELTVINIPIILIL